MIYLQILILISNCATGQEHGAEGKYTETNSSVKITNCESISADFRINWYYDSRSLSRFLYELQSLNCSQFEKQCSERPYDFTQYTNLIYLKFCNPTELEKLCYKELQSVLHEQSSVELSASWIEIIKEINFLALERKDLEKPCLQVAMYKKSQNPNDFVELVEVFLPFCPVVWCGFDKNVLNSSDISVWTCMTLSCQRNIVIIVVFYGFLAVAITFCNLMVLGVNFTNKKLINAQIVFRISLAFSDCLVGIVVLPSIMFNTVHYLSQSLVAKHQNNSLGVNWNQTGYSTELHSEVVHLPLPQAYIKVVGILTFIGMISSVLTLTMAAIDRFFAIYRPLRYRTSPTISIAYISAIAMWSISIVSALFPLVFNGINYTSLGSTLVFVNGKLAMIIYLLSFCLPLLLVWCFTIATFAAYKTHNSTRKYIRSNIINKNEMKKHIKLMTTLGVMALAFTVATTPLITLISTLFLDDEKFMEKFNLTPENSTNTFPILRVIVTVLFLTNSLSNFFIYSVRDKMFRNAAKKLFTEIIRTTPRLCKITV